MADLAKILSGMPREQQAAMREQMDGHGDGPTMSKYEANYLEASPSPDVACQNCSMYRSPGRCTLVKGVINPGGHCDHFDPVRQPEGGGETAGGVY